MTLTFTRLGEILPAGVVEYVGNNQVKFNFSQLSHNPLSLDSSFVEGIVKLLQGLAELTDEINQERASQNPPLEPIEFATAELTGTPGRPVYKFVIQVAVNTQAFADNLVDPTAN
ncbi:hypothetical protein BZZ01_32785 (plasmid) [Nostocales cyanobacterium HT-58-2]|nr:hypothetical protein BZZ01_32785 [Nostocales cyanobacterium HT-58-2]